MLAPTPAPSQGCHRTDQSCRCSSLLPPLHLGQEFLAFSVSSSVLGCKLYTIHRYSYYKLVILHHSLGVPGDGCIGEGVDDQDDDDYVEGVEQPIINHLVVCSLGHHLVDAGLYRGDHHHGGDRNHDPILNQTLVLINQEYVVTNLKVGEFEVECHVCNADQED